METTPLKRWMALLLLLGWSSMSFAQEERVLFSAGGGFYEDSFQLSLECIYPNHHIRYTTNGSSPDHFSELYAHPLTLNEELYSRSKIHTIVNCIPSDFFQTENVEHAIVIRAAVFNENDSCISPVFTNSYFIQSLGCDTHHLPVLSIVADSLSLFDYETGIFLPGIHYDPANPKQTGNYHQRGRAWERPINMEFYETDNRGINQCCGLRTHGGASRRYQQKGMRLYAREEYGTKKFNHQFFSTTPIDKFKRLNLHPFCCSKWLQTGGQEHLSQIAASNLDIDAMAVRQIVVFINGEYWGIYTLEESPDERYLESHYDVDLDKVNIIKYWEIEQYGDSTDWTTFKAWMRNADLSQPEDSAYAYSHIDVPNFIDYMLFETYTANHDWPHNNVLLWQAETGAPFRWLFFDGDGCFTKPEFNALENATHSGGNSVIFNHFLENRHFRDSFRKRYDQLKSTTFSPTFLQSVLDNYAQLIEGEIPSQSERFGFPTGMSQWRTDMEAIQQFFLTREEYFQQEILAYISVGEITQPHDVCFPNPSNGAIHIRFQSDNDNVIPIRIHDLSGRLVYYKEVKVHPSENSIIIEPELRNGVYFLRMGEIITRIIIEKQF